MIKKLGLYAEILGAYLEGKLPNREMSIINKVIESNRDMAEIIREIKNTEKKVDWNRDINKDFPDFENDFELPDINED